MVRWYEPTACIPDCVGLVLVAILHALVYVGFGVASRHQYLSQKGDVGYGQSQSVYLGQALLVGERRDVTAQLLESRVDAQHPLSLPDVGGVPLHFVGMMGHQPARPALGRQVQVQGFVHRVALVLCARTLPGGMHLQVGESQLRVREHGLTAERRPGRQLPGRCGVVQQQAVQLALELEVLVHLAPKCKIRGAILVEIKQYVFHVRRVRVTARGTQVRTDAHGFGTRGFWLTNQWLTVCPVTAPVTSHGLNTSRAPVSPGGSLGPILKAEREHLRTLYPSLWIVHCLKNNDKRISRSPNHKCGEKHVSNYKVPPK